MANYNPNDQEQIFSAFFNILARELATPSPEELSYPNMYNSFEDFELALQAEITNG